MRLIDADALKERMYHYAFEEDRGKWDSGCWIRYKLFEKAVDESPTIEQLEVVEQYCEKRCLVVMTRELFAQITKEWPGLLRE